VKLTSVRIFVQIENGSIRRLKMILMHVFQVAVCTNALEDDAVTL
jgi:hypothetical protein